MDIELAQALKENAELKNKLKHRNCLDCSNHSSKLRLRTLELEKENAELKDKACCIIEDLKALYFSPVVTKDDLKRQDKILAEAEQFLIEPNDRFEVTEKGKEYLRSH